MPTLPELVRATRLDRQQRKDQQIQKNTGILDQAIMKSKEEESYQRAADQIKSYAQNVFGLDNPYGNITSRDVRMLGAEQILQEMDFEKQRRDAENMDVKTTETVTDEKTGETTEQKRPLIDVSYDTQQRGDFQQWNQTMSNQFKSLAGRQNLTQPIIDRVKTAPPEKYEQEKLNAQREMQLLNEYSIAEESISKYATENGIKDFDTAKYEGRIAEGEDTNTVLRDMKEDWWVKSYEVSTQNATNKALESGNKTIIKLADDPDTMLIMQTMKDSDEFGYMFDEDGFPLPNFANNPELIKNINRYSSMYKNESEGIGKEISALNSQLSEAESNNRKIYEAIDNDGMKRVLLGLGTGLFKVDETSKQILDGNNTPIEGIGKKEFDIIKGYSNQMSPIMEIKAQRDEKLMQSKELAESLQAGKLDALDNVLADLGGVGGANIASDYVVSDKSSSISGINLDDIDLSGMGETKDEKPLSTKKAEAYKVAYGRKQPAPDTEITIERKGEKQTPSVVAPISETQKEGIKQRAKTQDEIEKVKERVKSGKIPTVYHKEDHPKRFVVLDEKKYGYPVIVDTFTNKAYDDANEVKRKVKNITNEQLVSLGGN